jgi:hypothetical protein
MLLALSDLLPLMQGVLITLRLCAGSLMSFALLTKLHGRTRRDFCAGAVRPNFWSSGRRA